MAELILTDDEKAALTWLELPDETVGRVVKKIAADLRLFKDTSEIQRLWVTTAAIMLASYAHDREAARLKIGLKGLFEGGRELGDFAVEVVRER